MEIDNRLLSIFSYHKKTLIYIENAIGKLSELSQLSNRTCTILSQRIIKETLENLNKVNQKEKNNCYFVSNLIRRKCFGNKSCLS